MLTLVYFASLVAQAVGPQQVEMTPAGWAIMTVSLTAVAMLNAFCFYRVLTIPAAAAEQHLKAPLEIDTGDLNDPD